MSSVAIVGGGLLGMSLAARLARQGHRVTILEAAPRSGGLAAPACIGEYTWDRFYHVILQSDEHLRELLEELDLTDRLIWKPARTGFYLDGTLRSLSSTLEFLKFPALNLVDKARLGLTILYASRIRAWRRLESVLASEWLVRWSGRRTWERLWLPLLRAKLGDNAGRASAAFIWAIIARMYGARRTGMKRETFVYDARVRRVESLGDRVRVTTASGDREFDNVVLTVPCARVAELCPDLTEEERTRLRAVQYQGIICAAILLDRPLAGYYITNITDGRVPFTAVIEMTALVKRARFGGHALVYLPKYLTQQDPYWSRSDAEIEREFLTALERMYPGFCRTQVRAFQVSRVREMLAVSTLEYSSRLLPESPTSLERVFIVNSAQIANGTLNVNETVGLAARKAGDLQRLLRGGRASAPAPAGAA
jgi:protoporphyrinogen oxidase